MRAYQFVPGLSTRELLLDGAGIYLRVSPATDAARNIVKFLKDRKLKKVQTAVQGDQVRVSSPSKDELQVVMQLLREQDFGVSLQFGNYRT